MNKDKDMSSHIEGLQTNPDYVIFNNPLANPKFVRKLSRTETKSINEIYTPKLFVEIASRLKPEDLQGLSRNESINITLTIKDFLSDINVTHKQGYGYLIDSADMLQSTILKWKQGDEEISTPIVSKMIHNKRTGKIELFIDSDLAKRLLEVKKQENFSFLKKNFYKLQNGQAIKFYQFFKSWLGKGRYETKLENFKEQFGFNTSGYKRYSLFEKYVLKPATEEINNKTDIIVKYELVGENLDGKKPRITGLIFRITAKEKIKVLPSGDLHKKPEPNEPGETDSKEVPLFEVETQTQDNKELYDLFKKIPTEEKPDETTAKILIDSWVKLYGYELMKDGFLGLIATKAKAKSVAFFTKENLAKYKGFSKELEAKEQQKEQKRESEKQQETKKKQGQEIKIAYHKARKEHYLKRYNELSDEQREGYLQDLWDSEPMKSIHFIKNNIKEPNSYGIERVGEYLTFPNGYNEKEVMKNYAKKEFGVDIAFDGKEPYVL